MKPKRGSNNKRQKQQQQNVRQQQLQQQKISADDTKTSKNDDVMKPPDVTSSVSECQTPTDDTSEPTATQTERENFLNDSPGGATYGAENRCPDDVEVADILHAEPPVTLDPDQMTSDPAVTVGGVHTELIMAKTFTESTQPEREFVPIRGADANDTRADDPTSRLAVRCELVTAASGGETTSGRTAMTSSGSGVESARLHVKDLTSDFRHLQALLDDVLTSPHAVCTSSDDEELEQDQEREQECRRPRVVYRYHLRDGPPTTRRWITRAGTEGRVDDVVEQSTEHLEERGIQAASELKFPTEGFADEETTEHGNVVGEPVPGEKDREGKDDGCSHQAESSTDDFRERENQSSKDGGALQQEPEVEDATGP